MTKTLPPWRARSAAAAILLCAACTAPARTSGSAPPSAQKPPTGSSPARSPDASPADRDERADAPKGATRAIRVTVLPSPAYIEVGDGGQLVNCDFLVSNDDDETWTLAEIQVTVLDGKGALAWRKILSGNGSNPGITTIPGREIRGGQKMLVFNPLFAFPRDLELARLRYELTFERGQHHQPTSVFASVDVVPVLYQNRARLRLPLRGRFIVWDGHDFLSHHRRWDYQMDILRELGFTSNAGRYSYDFIPVDGQGEMFRSDENRNESWFGFGQPIHATAPGRVVAVVDTRPDDRQIDMKALESELLAVYGNYVIIDHGGGEVSLFGHIRRGSARVAVGAQVRAGQEIAAIGASGSSLMPHLHYQLQTTATANAEGLPSYFHGFRKVRGARVVPVERGQVDSGDILENGPPGVSR